MNIETMKQWLEALENNRRYHYYCEDTWYSCPKHEEGCANEAEGNECNCGADEANAVIDASITSLRQAIAEAEKQEPDDLTIAYMSGLHDGKKQRQQERNFCERCGKQLGKNEWDVHTCTPPAEVEKHEVSQEPVVWMYQDKISHAVKFQKHMSDFVDHSRWYETPLYTTSPQRKQEHEWCRGECLKCGASIERQEPVAWVSEIAEEAELMLEKPRFRAVALYSSPPQRQPLTDEQISAIDWKQNETLHDFARAIEAAHNIFGEKK